ncbi:hypothetical protein K4K58_002114 [Colletotrichum sp. SAR11_239]|nr:hypothetical protein K4K58_002114 [Colletotrichum sp. SAR11_239]
MPAWDRHREFTPRNAPAPRYRDGLDQRSRGYYRSQGRRGRGFGRSSPRGQGRRSYQSDRASTYARQHHDRRAGWESRRSWQPTRQPQRPFSLGQSRDPARGAERMPLRGSVVVVSHVLQASPSRGVDAPRLSNLNEGRDENADHASVLPSIEVDEPAFNDNGYDDLDWTDSRIELNDIGHDDLDCGEIWLDDGEYELGDFVDHQARAVLPRVGQSPTANHAHAHEVPGSSQEWPILISDSEDHEAFGDPMMLD